MLEAQISSDVLLGVKPMMPFGKPSEPIHQTLWNKPQLVQSQSPRVCVVFMKNSVSKVQLLAVLRHITPLLCLPLLRPITSLCNVDAIVVVHSVEKRRAQLFICKSQNFRVQIAGQLGQTGRPYTLFLGHHVHLIPFATKCSFTLIDLLPIQTLTRVLWFDSYVTIPMCLASGNISGAILRQIGTKSCQQTFICYITGHVVTRIPSSDCQQNSHEQKLK
mmetsp:Transcript_103920/g.199474  ORF Transcript_103920/g.199474 Transcript_103920/m.199474 type:complete len:219 (+) Transcript_103920:441-1097(+)